MRNRLVVQSCVPFLAAVVVCGILAQPAVGQADDTSYAQRVRSLHPVAYWRFSELQGKAVEDEISSRFGWIRGNVQWGAAGPALETHNAAVRFDGRSGCIRIPHDDALRPDRGAIACWFNPENVQTTQGLFSKDASGFGDGGHVTLTLQPDAEGGGQLYARLQSSTASYELLGGQIQPHRWHHAVLTFGPTGLKLYLDGRQVGSNPYVGGLGVTSGSTGNREPLVLGASTMVSQPGSEVPLQHFFHGRLDEVALFDRQLDAEQVGAWFAAARPTYGSLAAGYALNGPLAWWRLNEAPGALTAREQVDQLHGHYHVNAPFFDGDDHVDAGVLDVEGESMTILACLRPASFAVPDARIVAKSTALAMEDQYWMLSTALVEDRPRLRFRLQTSNGVRETVGRQDVVPNAWIFVAGVYDGTMLRLYQDGELAGSFPHGGRIKTNSHAHVWIGDSPAGAGRRPFDGAIRDVAVFDRALSDGQIRAIFQAKTMPPPAPPAERMPPARAAAPPVVQLPPPPIVGSTTRRAVIPPTRYRLCVCPDCGELYYEPIQPTPVILDGHVGGHLWQP